MPPRRNRNLNDIHEQEFEQRVMARMEERMGQFVDQLTDHMNDLMNQRRPRNRNRRESEDEESENPFGEGDGSSSDEQERRPRRNEREDNRRWESGLRVNIPDFDGDTLNPEGFIDWLAAVEEVFEFKDIPENKRVPLIATKLRGRASAWWQQLKLTRERVGKPKVTTWQKMKKCMRANFIPHNYQRLMYQRLQNLKQGAKSVEDYTTEFYQLIARNDIQETEEQLVSRYIGGLRFQIMDSVNMFDPVTLSDAHQRALAFEKQNRRVGGSSSSAITGGSSGSGNVTSRFVPNQAKQGSSNTGPVSKGVGSSTLKCFNCGEPGHRQSECKKAGKRHLFADPDGLHEVHKTVHDNLVRANSKYKQDADQKRRHVDFEVGDFVWAVLTKDRFSVGEYNKLSAKKIGPLEIVEKINSNAYRLKLPSHIRCSDVFNVKHLLPYHGDSDDDLAVNSRANFVYPGGNDGGPSVEERAIMFLEAQDRVTKGASLKWA
ncbi:reverse transcriptase domain-containing protein [Artemisia annua]|uniref:Reverse transcriptase domain-containing protein n=1 Tax=Artemisia annua TaxID=35608 RepID=A0A2U1N466_ARTAN|nr:reverse transcriptase domain-containing protein [Artemisia annua]PWA68269.1 reverse transcriptase domain-containing protein [Artemisia annua]